MGVGGDWGSGPCGFVLLYVEYARDLPVPHHSTQYKVQTRTTVLVQYVTKPKFSDPCREGMHVGPGELPGQKNPKYPFSGTRITCDTRKAQLTVK